MDSSKPAGTETKPISSNDVAPGNQAATHLDTTLSALMDSEADELELRRLLRALPGDPELAATWKRYHAVRASLHQEIHSNPAVDLLPGIKERIAAEAEIPVTLRARILRSGAMRLLGQGAIAASVAVAALLGVSLLESPSGDSLPVAAVTEVSQSATPAMSGNFRAEELARSAVSDPEALERLEQAVYQGLSDLPPPAEIPVSYNPDFPQQPRITE